MTKQEMNSLATLVSKAVVTALKEASAPSNKSRGSANEAPKKKAPTKPKYSVRLEDYEPKGEKTKKGYTNWNSYNSQRTKFCYAFATSGKAVGCFENGKRVCSFEQIDEEYAEAKALFEKKYKYVKKADR